MKNPVCTFEMSQSMGVLKALSKEQLNIALTFTEVVKR
jgi:hypothetical protein